MDIALRLIEHLLETKFSIDRVDSIVKQLMISKEQLLQTINDDQCTDFFQLLRPANNQGKEKVALTLDLFCCTHYANGCKNQSCPFLHLCPYNVRPMHTKCTNKACQFEHQVSKSAHNKRIINARDLSFIPANTLHEITRASADPNRSFWVCNDYGKKNGCTKRLNCDKLHYCYYSLIGSCTKPHCQHEFNDACRTYFRQKEINEQQHDDVLDAFRKVLRQRKTDYIDSVNPPHQASSASASSKSSNAGNNSRKPSASQQHRPSPVSRRPKSTTSEISPSLYDDVLSSRPDPPPPVPDDEQDILLVDHHDKREYRQMEANLSRELSCPIRLLFSKEIISKKKPNVHSNPIYYYYPMKNPADLFQSLRWQNEDKHSIQPLLIYASLRDAHDAAQQNFEDNQFCIIRVHLFHSDAIDGDLLPQNRLQLNNASTMRFDHMWIYVFDLS